MENFNSFGLDKNILENLSKLRLIKPTPIQIQAIKKNAAPFPLLILNA